MLLHWTEPHILLFVQARSSEAPVRFGTDRRPQQRRRKHIKRLCITEGPPPERPVAQRGGQILSERKIRDLSKGDFMCKYCDVGKYSPECRCGDTGDACTCSTLNYPTKCWACLHDKLRPDYASPPPSEATSDPS